MTTIPYNLNEVSQPENEPDTISGPEQGLKDQWFDTAKNLKHVGVSRKEENPKEIAEAQNHPSNLATLLAKTLHKSRRETQYAGS